MSEGLLVVSCAAWRLMLGTLGWGKKKNAQCLYMLSRMLQ